MMLVKDLMTSRLANLESSRHKPTGEIAAAKVEAVLDGANTFADMALHAVVDLPGRLDLSTLRNALACVANAELAVGARYMRRRLRSAWVIDPAPQWPLTEYHDVDPHLALKREAELISEPFKPAKHLPVTLRLLHMDRHDRLLIRISHLLADAGGIKTFLYSLAAACRKLREYPFWLPATGNSGTRGMPRSLCSACFPHLGPVIRGMVTDTISFFPKRFFFVPMAATEAFTSCVAVLRVDSERLARLKQRWQPKGITVNDLLLTAFSRSLEKCFAGNPGQRERMGLVVTADLRRHLSPNDYIRNMSSLRVLDLGKLPLPSPIAHLKRVARRTARWKRTKAGLGASLLAMACMGLLPDGLIRSLTRTALGRGLSLDGCRIALTNMGILDERKLDFGDGPCLGARLSPPVALPPLMIAGATGCAGTLSFSLGFRHPSLRKEEAERLLKELDRELSLLE